MGSQLLDLRIKGDCITKHYVNDATLEVISEHCPNLKHFSYTLAFICYYNESRDAPSVRDSMMGTGLLALVGGCRRLEVLEIERVCSRNTFVTILNMLEQGEGEEAAASASGINRGGFALRKIIAKSYPFVIADYPFHIEDQATANPSNRFANAGALFSEYESD